MAQILPSIGAEGAWQLKAPFDEKISSELSYKCVAIRKISEMVTTGIDVLNTHYIPNGLLKTDYDADVIVDASVVTLVSSSGSWVFVPTTYILGWPSADSVPYAVVAMGVVLGALPNTVDASFLIDKVKNVIRANLGNEPEILLMTVSETTMKTQEQHESLEAARQANITETMTDYNAVQVLQAQLDAANETIRQLMEYYESQPDVPPVDLGDETDTTEMNGFSNS